MAKATIKLTNGVSWGAIVTPDEKAVSNGKITLTFVGTGNAVNYPLAVMATQVKADKSLVSLYADTTATGVITVEGTFAEDDKIVVIAQRAVEVTTEADEDAEEDTTTDEDGE